MAPAKRPQASVARKEKKQRRRPGNTEDLFNCIGNLCGEECDHPVTDAMDLASSYSDDEDYVARAPPTLKTSRVAKTRSRKEPPSLPMKLGVQKAQRYICEALEFGMNAGYLTPKDSKGKVLVLSSELMQMSDAIKGVKPSKGHSPPNEPRTVGGQSQRRGNAGHRHQQPEPRDEDATDVEESHGKRRRSSHSKRHGRRRSGRSHSRSRSRSKRRSRRRAGRSRSVNPDGEERTNKQNNNASEESPHDAMEETTNNGAGSNGRDLDDNHSDDTKSVKSTTSSKSVKRSESSQSAATDSKKHEDDGDEDYGDDYEDKK